MRKKELDCDKCPIKGYSQEICKLHIQHETKESSHHQASPSQAWGKKAALVAGIGLVGVVAGATLLPALGMKVLVGDLLLP